MAGPRIPPEKVARIEELAAAGWTMPAIAEAVEVSLITAWKRVRAYREEHGMPSRLYRRAASSGAEKPVRRPSVRSTTPEQDRQIERLVVLGHTHAVIAAEVGATLAVVDIRAARFKKRVQVDLPRSVRRNAVPRATVQAVEEALAAGRPAVAIRSDFRLKKAAVEAIARRWRKRNGIAAPRLRRGSPPPSAELLRLIEERVSEAEIIRRLDVTAWKVERARAYYFALHPDALCGCGQPLRHQGSCPARMPAPHNRISPDALARIATWTELGYAAAPIAKRLGIGRACVNRNRRLLMRALKERGALCACDRVVGHKALCPQQRLDPPADEPIPVSAAKLLAAIRRHVPRTLDPALRDDIVSDLYLAVLQGEVTETDIGSAAPRFISRAFATWADKWGAKSMDAPLGDGDERTLADTLEDGTGASLLDELEFGDR